MCYWLCVTEDCVTGTELTLCCDVSGCCIRIDFFNVRYRLINVLLAVLLMCCCLFKRYMRELSVANIEITTYKPLQHVLPKLCCWLTDGVLLCVQVIH